MGLLRWMTAGESHGPAEVCLVEGIPAGLRLSAGDIDADLVRRQRGYGRGGRMLIEHDQVQILAGVRLGETLGTPIALLVENRDHANWRPSMQPEALDGAAPSRVTVPRPGHADLAGVAKFDRADVRDVLERASARATVGTVAAGAVAKTLLRALGVSVKGRVVAVGGVASSDAPSTRVPYEVDWEAVERSPVACSDSATEALMCAAVDEARAQGDSLGGVFEIWAWDVWPGLGGYGSPSQRLDGRLMGAVGSIPAIKGVEIGLGFGAASRPGSLVHDPLVLAPEEAPSGAGTWITRARNNAGGLEGGVTNGMPVVVRGAMKPIPTMTRPLPSVDLQTLQPVDAHRERSDVEAVAAARVVGEAAVALELAVAVLEKFGGDTLADLLAAVEHYEQRLEARGLWRPSSA